MGGAPSPPPPPDPMATAQAQTGMNIGTAEAQDLLNMVNQVTPYGGLTYTQTGTTPMTVAGQAYKIPRFTATQSFTPAGQAQLNYQLATGLNAGEAAQGLSGQLANLFSKPIELPGTPDYRNQAVDEQLYSEYAPRIQQQQDIQGVQLDATLRAQGLTPGSPAYNNAVMLENNRRNDQWNQMYLTGRGEAVNEMQRNYENQVAATMQAYNFPLQALSTLMGQGAPQQPSFAQTPSTSISPANYEGDVQNAYADQMQAYQAQLQQSNAMMGGLFSLGSTLMGGFGMSDERLKEGPDGGPPEKVGELDNETPVYAYRFKSGGPVQIGLLAQEVEKIHPEAVKNIGKYKAVNYERAVV